MGLIIRLDINLDQKVAIQVTRDSEQVFPLLPDADDVFSYDWMVFAAGAWRESGKVEHRYGDGLIVLASKVLNAAVENGAYSPNPSLPRSKDHPERP